MIGVFVQVGVVQPQEGCASVMTTGALVLFLNLNVTSAGGPILIGPKS